MRQLVFFLILVWTLPGYTNEQVQRYRGSYTLGHEVNIFCPEINSQCYWLSPSTEIQIRQQLQQLSKKHTIKPYQAVCVVIQGNIDRESRRVGFAANYAGLIEIVKVFGFCGQPEMVTQGDLQHHRWILESINGVISVPLSDSPSELI
ncbi:hypothetical protein BMR11_18320 [Methylococcaceae bacterium CS5]|nr:hypothetical protein BMR11_18320 [Methylococcaceae bacterium CS5]